MDNEARHLSLGKSKISIAMPCGAGEVEFSIEERSVGAWCLRDPRRIYGAELRTGSPSAKGGTLFDDELAQFESDPGTIRSFQIGKLRGFRAWAAEVEPTMWQVVELEPNQLVLLMAGGSMDNAEEVSVRADQYFDTLKIDGK